MYLRAEAYEGVLEPYKSEILNAAEALFLCTGACFGAWAVLWR